MKTAELTGAALDWAVRYANNGSPPKDYVPARDNFSTCWNKGGPIIEREGISVISHNKPNHWVARTTDYPSRYIQGPTPLIAAMRCYVASKLGDEVDVPEELIS